MGRKTMLTRISAALFALYLVHDDGRGTHAPARPAAEIKPVAETVRPGGETAKAIAEAGANAPRAALAYCLAHPELCRRVLETAGDIARPASSERTEKDSHTTHVTVRLQPAPKEAGNAAADLQPVDAPLPPRRPARV
jgi:hypothetical protein